jgi:hypothetical protein
MIEACSHRCNMNSSHSIPDIESCIRRSQAKSLTSLKATRPNNSLIAS